MFGKERVVLQIAELIKDWPCTVQGGAFRKKVVGVTENSTDVQPGYVFVARKGDRFDGFAYIEDAIRRGAVAIVTDRPYNKTITEDIPILTVPDCRTFISHASATLAGHPSDRLTVIAVTGTNGKTTVTHFIGQLLQLLGKQTAVIGTTGIFINGSKMYEDYPAMTTLSAEHLHPLLLQCEEAGVTHIVMEASSLGLSGHRLRDCKIDIGIMLNVGSDHFDEHGGKEEYIRAKEMLLGMAECLVVNVDDPICYALSQKYEKPKVLFGTSEHATLQISKVGPYHYLQNQFNQIDIPLGPPGHYNLMNATAAIGALTLLGYTLIDVQPHIHRLSLPEGRLQLVEHGGIRVYVDYAHTPDALEAVLVTLASISDQRLITIFGCGGERSKGKRAEMGEIAALYSSFVYVTSDNPRSEDPYTIISEIMTGFGEVCTAVEAEPDRKEAIRKAVQQAVPGDIILIAGKGHEKEQHTALGVFPFSDIEIAKAVLLEKNVMFQEQMIHVQSEIWYDVE